MSTLNLRVLRPGSSTITDQTLLAAFSLWEELEDRLGLEFDARAVSYAASREGNLSLEQTYSLLWPRGREARGFGSSTYSRYGTLPPADRLMMADRLRGRIAEVQMSPGCESEVVDALAGSGAVRLVARCEATPELQRLIRSLLTSVIDVGSVSGHPRVVGGDRNGGIVHVEMELPEAAK
jgi:hypothetical protein